MGKIATPLKSEAELEMLFDAMARSDDTFTYGRRNNDVVNYCLASIALGIDDADKIETEFYATMNLTAEQEYCLDSWEDSVKGKAMECLSRYYKENALTKMLAMEY